MAQFMYWVSIYQKSYYISTLNFNIKLNKISKILQPWQGNKLTIYGKKNTNKYFDSVSVHILNASVANP